jgi:DNA polymerase I
VKKNREKSQQKTLALFPEDEIDQSPLISRPPESAEKNNEVEMDFSDLSGKTVFVLDSHSLIYQVFHAIGEMTGPDGRAVNALFGFTRDLLDIFSKWKPDFLFAAFDFSDTTFRNEIYPEYKAHRDEMPADLRAQIPEIQRLLSALAIPILEMDGYEADDILATIARMTKERKGQCVLVTSDKDCRQLINDNVALLNLRKGQKYGAEHLVTDWGIRPDQVVDFQAMVGDTSDNVPGIPTIGPKTAMQLLNEFGTLENVLASAEKIKGKKGETIRDGREVALLSQQLVRLDDSVPLEIDWQAGRLGGMDVDQAVAICEEAGFRSLTERVQKLSPMVKTVNWVADYRTVDDLEFLRQIVAEIRERRVFSFDTETTSPLPRWADLVGISLAWQPGKAVYVPVRASHGSTTINEHDLVEVLQPLLGDPEILVIGQNLKYDLIVMRSLGVEIKCKLFDTMVADYLLNPGRTAHNMDDLALRFLRHKTIKITQLIGKRKTQRLMSDVPVPLITAYAAEDADVPLRLYNILEGQLRTSGLWDLFDEIEMKLVSVLAEMEFHGITVDRKRLEELSLEFGSRLGELESQIHEMAGEKFNLDSPRQLAEILFEKLKLPVVKKTKLARSTDIEVLDELADRHPLPRLMREYRQLAKLKNTYTDALLEQINPRTNRVHTCFQQDVARTGRLSSKDPNLQNIPIRTEEGRRIRRAFVATDPNWVLISGDYSQIELRVLTHFCEDHALKSAFENDEDIHSVVAAQVNGVPQSAVTAEMRRQAKAINFGIIYGQSAFGLANELGITKDAAAEFIEAYFQRYPAIDAFLNGILEEAWKNREVRTILGRRRSVEGVRSPDRTRGNRSRTMPERIAINTVIQGSAADLIKKAMIEVHQSLATQFPRSRLLLQIHDELVVEAERTQINDVARLLRREMSNAFTLSVPLKVAVECGANWDDTEPCGD